MLRPFGPRFKKEIQRMFPIATESIEQALALFNDSLLEDAKSYGKVQLKLRQSSERKTFGCAAQA